jgi:3-methyl-2-oxobutanoate hydroxymethyltransferase
MRLTVNNIKEMKLRDERISMLTAYDYPTARILDEAGIPMILVGDSLGQVVLGYDSTVYVTMEDMIHHISAVARGSRRALVVGDMPFMSYQLGISETLKNAGRIIQEGGAQAVKLEGGENVAETVHQIVQCGIPVMGHIGLTPQSVNQLGGYKVQGKTPKAAAQLLRDAQALTEAGAFSIVLELVPTQLAQLITQRSSVPTIGIGAGKYCDGQVQVINDMVGLFTDFVPKHARAYASLACTIRDAVLCYVQEVSSGSFPSDRESYNIDEGILAEFLTHSQTS